LSDYSEEVAKRFKITGGINDSVKKHLSLILGDANLPAPKTKEEPVIPEPEFQTVGIMIGGTILLSAIRKIDEMYLLLEQDDVQGAADKAIEIVNMFPTESLRLWITKGKNVKTELNRRFEDTKEYPYENLMPNMKVATRWMESNEWSPGIEDAKRFYRELRELVITKQYLKEELAPRLIDTINVISAFVPSDNRLTAEELSAAIEEPKEDDEI
jgi:hypothetical protein